MMMMMMMIEGARGAGMRRGRSRFDGFDFDRVRRGDDTVGNPHRAQMSQFELFELIRLLKLDKQFPLEQFEATVSQSTVPSPPLEGSVCWFRHRFDPQGPTAMLDRACRCVNVRFRSVRRRFGCGPNPLWRLKPSPDADGCGLGQGSWRKSSHLNGKGRSVVREKLVRPETATGNLAGRAHSHFLCQAPTTVLARIRQIIRRSQGMFLPSVVLSSLPVPIDRNCRN